MAASGRQLWTAGQQQHAAADRARALATDQHQLRDQCSRIASHDHDATAWVGRHTELRAEIRTRAGPACP